MATPKLKAAPKPPDDFTEEQRALYRDSCARLLETGFMFKSDRIIVENFVRAFSRWKQVSAAADAADILTEKGKVNPLISAENELAGKLKSHWRAIESTVNERKRANRIEEKGEHGGQKGIRQGKARDGVPSFKKNEGGITWLDEIRNKNSDDAEPIH